MKNRVLKYFTNGDCRFRVNAVHGIYNNMSDEEYLKKLYKAWIGKELDLDNPKTLNEKLQWLKIHDRKELYTELVDKYAAKEFVRKILGSEYIIPTLGVWEHFDDIDFQLLPEKFVLKCTHDSHGIVICKNKYEFDVKTAKKKLTKALKRNYYYKFREWPYKNVKPQILAEQYIENHNGELTDYKFYCFNGKVDCVLICSDRASGNTKFLFFDRNWQLKRYNKQGREVPEGFVKQKPEGIEKMFDLAEVLAKASTAPFVRVDLYNVNGSILFGELTLYPAAGFDTGRLPETDILFGEKLKLDDVRES